jgi:hypothetical protein
LRFQRKTFLAFWYGTGKTLKVEFEAIYVISAQCTLATKRALNPEQKLLILSGTVDVDFEAVFFIFQFLSTEFVLPK